MLENSRNLKTFKNDKNRGKHDLPRKNKIGKTNKIDTNKNKNEKNRNAKNKEMSKRNRGISIVVGLENRKMSEAISNQESTKENEKTLYNVREN